MFAVVYPIATVPVFLSLSEKRTNEERKRIALRASIVGAALLMVFTFFGQGIFRLFGINLSAFRVAGGLLLLLTALDMFRAKLSDCRCTRRAILPDTRGGDPRA